MKLYTVCTLVDDIHWKICFYDCTPIVEESKDQAEYYMELLIKKHPNSIYSIFEMSNEIMRKEL